MLRWKDYATLGSTHSNLDHVVGSPDDTTAVRADDYVAWRAGNLNEDGQDRQMSLLGRRASGDGSSRHQGASLEQSANADPQFPEGVDSRVLVQSPSNSSQQSSRRRRQMRSAVIGTVISRDGNHTSPSASPSLELDRTRRRSLDNDQPSLQSSRSASLRGSYTNRTRQSSNGSAMTRGQLENDHLEVRNVSMSDGQSAALVLEDGKLQRIVSSSGNVIEVLWKGRDRGGPDRRLAINLRTANQSTIEEPETAKHSPSPNKLRKFADSLQSHRLSSSNVTNNTLYSVPHPEERTKSMRDMRTLHSLDLSRSKAKGTQSHRQSMQISSSSPEVTKPARTASFNDMSTIVEASGEVKSEQWNPMGSSWLPSAMTRQPNRTPDSISPTVQKKKRHIHSMPVGKAMASPRPEPQTPKSQTSSFTKSSSADKGATSKQGLPTEKKKIWKTIKAFLHIPSSKKGKSGSRAKGVEVARTLSFSESQSGQKMSPDDKEREMRARQSSPAGPARAVNSSSLPEGDVSQYGGVTTSAAQQRSPKPDDSVSYEDEATPEEKLAAYAAPSAASTPRNSGTRAMPQRHFQFGPSTESAKPPLPGGSAVQTIAQGRRMQQNAYQPLQTGRVFPDGGIMIDPAKAKALQSDFVPKLLVPPKLRTSLAGSWQKNFTEGTSGAKVDELLNVSSLQRLAREKTMEMQIVETDEIFEIRWHIPLNGSSSKISKVDKYLKNGEVVEGARRDGRTGILRSQLTFTPEGHVHIRALQGAPYSAVFHDRLKLSTGGRRIKIEQKFQLLEPGVPPVKHYSIWQRVE